MINSISTLNMNWEEVPEIFCSYDLEKDAQNRWAAMNKFMNGIWRKTMPEEDQEHLLKIKWLSFEESKDILIPYISKKIKNLDIDNIISEMTDIMDKNKLLIFEYMEKLTKHPILHNKFSVLFTTCKRGPYSRQSGWLQVYDPKFPERRERAWSASFAHELIHMQTHKYYENEHPMNQLNFQQFNLIKESLTFLLNHEFPWVNMAIDRWYPNHQEFRKVLEDYWISCWENKDFNKLIEFGCKYIFDNNILL